MGGRAPLGAPPVTYPGCGNDLVSEIDASVSSHRAVAFPRCVVPYSVVFSLLASSIVVRMEDEGPGGREEGV